MKTLSIFKLADKVFEFVEGELIDDVITANGVRYGGNDVKLSYFNTEVKVDVNGQKESFKFDKIDYDNGTDVVTFTSADEVITTLVADGFTGNFNTPQAGGDYATTEKVIGSLNGDTLFRKCFFPEDTSSFVSISHGIDSINFLAKGQISCVVDAGSYGVFDINNSSVILGETSLTQTDVYIDNANLFALTNILIILEYTKQPA